MQPPVNLWLNSYSQLFQLVDVQCDSKVCNFNNKFTSNSKSSPFFTGEVVNFAEKYIYDLQLTGPIVKQIVYLDMKGESIQMILNLQSVTESSGYLYGGALSSGFLGLQPYSLETKANNFIYQLLVQKLIDYPIMSINLSSISPVIKFGMPDSGSANTGESLQIFQTVDKQSFKVRAKNFAVNNYLIGNIHAAFVEISFESAITFVPQNDYAQVL
jgi:hypothetical protein